MGLSYMGQAVSSTSRFPPRQRACRCLLSMPVCRGPRGGLPPASERMFSGHRNPPLLLWPNTDGRGNAFLAPGWGCPWESSRRASFFTAQSGIPPSGDDTIVPLHKFEKLGVCEAEGTGPGSSSLCYVLIHHNPDQSIPAG